MDKNVLELIPQRPPMVMIDRLTFCELNTARASLLITEDNVFVRNGFFEESGMIEALAQTAAARTGWMSRKDPMKAAGPAPKGVIGSIRDFRLGFLPMTGDQLEMEIEVVHEFMNASVVNGVVRVNGKEACRAELKIFLTEDNQQ